MLPPATDPGQDPPPPRFPPRRPRRPLSGLSPGETALLVAIVFVGLVDIMMSIEIETWKAIADWMWRTGTPEGIQPGIDVILGKEPRPQELIQRR